MRMPRGYGLAALPAPPSMARYDRPRTPWFMRRNEIWSPVATDD